MPANDQPLRLMIVDDSVEAAEAIVSTLRNAGIAVRPLRPDSPESLAAILGEEVQSVDLVLAAQAATLVPLAAVLDAIKASGKDLPVVTIVDRVDATGLAVTPRLEAKGLQANSLQNVRVEGSLVLRKLVHRDGRVEVASE